MKKRILITGFEPFQSEQINPSRILALQYQHENQYSTLVLPVSYSRAWSELQNHLKDHDYDFVLLLGQAGGRKNISLERTALNLQDSEIPDEDQDLRIQKRISIEGPDAFLSPLPLREWARRLQSQNLPVEISLSAGAYVCNSLYFQAFEHFKNLGKSTQVLFVHVPFIPEQMSGKRDGTPFLPLEVIKKSLDEILKLIESES